MEKTLLPVLLAALAWGCSSCGALAEPPMPAREPMGQARGQLQQVLETLTPVERQEFIAAHRMARNDPALIAAKSAKTAAQMEFKHVMKNAMLLQDPSLAAVFEKMEQPAATGKAPTTVPGQQAQAPQRLGWAALLKDLTQEERQKMKAARAAVKNQGEVQQVEAARAAADKEFSQAFRTAMLNAAPSIGPVLDKVEAAIKEKEGAMRRGLETETPAR